MLGMAIRIARRMGLHKKATYARCNPLQAELCRRLWWSLITFDNRICEMFDYHNSTLDPTWDCDLPTNVNDSDIWLEMNNPPQAYERPTEAIFVVVRSELSEFLRRSAFHLDYINPTLKSLAAIGRDGTVPESEQLTALEAKMDNRYLSFCNLDNPLHCITVWFAKASFSKCHLLEYYSKDPKSAERRTEARRSSMSSHALRMLEYDTKMMNLPSMKRYVWFVDFNFPFPAYMHLLQELRQRPSADYAPKAWETMSDNYKVRMGTTKHPDSPLLIIFSRMVLHAWKARESLPPTGEFWVPPPMVADIKSKMGLTTPASSEATVTSSMNYPLQRNDIGELPVPPPADLGTMPETIATNSVDTMPWSHSQLPGQGMVDIDMNQFDWTAIDWNNIHPGGA
jgi:hypothetical protein